MKKIIMSVGMIVFVAALVAGGTGAFFSDTETSTGNIFTAGAIDLQIDNSSYGFDWNDPEADDPSGDWGLNSANSWDLTDLDGELFFNFIDLKPGDFGEDTISLHVTDNDAYACMAFNQTGTPENGQNEPEAAVDPTDGDDEGELQNYLSFLFWHDDGDNILEEGEEIIDSLSGLSSDIFSGEWLAIADGDDDPLPGASTNYIAKGWCFGDIAPDREPQDNLNTAVPTEDTTGFSCTGAAGDHNDAQTDGIVVDVSFYAVQARNNDDFSCAALPPLDGGEPVDDDLVVVSPDDFNGWEAYDDDFVGDGTTTFIPDGTATIGDGVLRLETVGNDSRVGLFNDLFNLDLNGVQISYDSNQVSATDTVNGNATIRLWIDTTGDNVADDQLMYEPYFNLFAENSLNDASIVPNTWQTWSLNNTNGKMWSNNGVTYNGKGAPGYATNLVIDDVLIDFPATKIVGISFSMGTFNPDQVVLVDNFIMNGTTYDFEN